MGRKRIEGLPSEVKRVRVQLDEWRAHRRRGQRIPALLLLPFLNPEDVPEAQPSSSFAAFCSNP